MIVDAYKVTSEVIADYPGLDFDAVHSQLKLILDEAQDVMTVMGKPFGMSKKIAHIVCAQERANLLASSDRYYYRPSDVRKALESLFDGPLDQGDVPDDYRSLLVGSDAMDFRSDVLAAFKRLPLKLRVALYSQYGLGDKPANASYERKLVDKAIKELVYELNGAV